MNLALVIVPKFQRLFLSTSFLYIEYSVQFSIVYFTQLRDEKLLTQRFNCDCDSFVLNGDYFGVSPQTFTSFHTRC